MELRAGRQFRQQAALDQESADRRPIIDFDRRVQRTELGGIGIDPVDGQLRGIADHPEIDFLRGTCVAGRRGTAACAARQRADRRHRRPGPWPSSRETAVGPGCAVLQHHAFRRDAGVRVAALGAGFLACVGGCCGQEQSQSAGACEFQMRHLRSPSAGVWLNRTHDGLNDQSKNRAARHSLESSPMDRPSVAYQT